MLDRSKAPALHRFGHMTLPSCQTEILDNGLTLHTLAGGNRDIARISLIIEGGPSDTSNPCIANFAGELLREGSSLHSGEQLADILDFNGAWLTSSTSGHYTVLRLSALTSKIPDLLDDLIACLVSPSFDATPFEAIKRKAVAQQRLNLSKVAFLAACDNRRLICGENHPDSRLVLPEQIEAIDIKTVRTFHQSRIDTRRIHAFLAGKFDEDFVEVLRRKLSDIKTAPKPSPIAIVPYCAMEPQSSFVDKPDSLQSAVYLSIPAISRSHPDYNGLRMAVTALGGYFGSRLMSNIREDKGYTYGISASLLGSLDGSYIAISAQCDNSYTDALLDEVRHELDDMAKKPLQDAELERLRFNVASDLASTLDSPLTVMDYMELKLLVGIPDDYFDSRQQLTTDITAADICRLSEKYLKASELRTSVAGQKL